MNVIFHRRLHWGGVL